MKFIVEQPELVNVKHKDNLKILKYKRKVFYDNLWTPNLQECRGLVLDEEDNIVSRPFTKIFNYQENNTTIPLTEKVLWTKKHNGFMAAQTGNLVTTTGSFDSDFVDMAKEFIHPTKQKGTLLFEIVHPNDPHIIVEKPGAYLIGYRSLEKDEPYNSSLEKEEFLDDLAEFHGWLRPEYGSATFGDLLEHIKSIKHEGFCVYGSTNLKVKSPYYLQSKAIARSNKQLQLDEEFTPLLAQMPKNLTEQERLAFIRSYFC
jgi:hypothetical protein